MDLMQLAVLVLVFGEIRQDPFLSCFRYRYQWIFRRQKYSYSILCVKIDACCSHLPPSVPRENTLRRKCVSSLYGCLATGIPFVKYEAGTHRSMQAPWVDSPVPRPPSRRHRRHPVGRVSIKKPEGLYDPALVVDKKYQRKY